jgi:hypothetical protein
MATPKGKAATGHPIAPFLLCSVSGLLCEIMHHTGIIIAIVDEVMRVLHIAQLTKSGIDEVDFIPYVNPR